MPCRATPQLMIIGILAACFVMTLAGASNARAAMQSLGAQTPPEAKVLLDEQVKRDPKKPRLAQETIWLVGDGTIQDAAGGKGKAPASGSVGVRHESAIRAHNVLGKTRTQSVERFLAFYGFGTSVDTVRGTDRSNFGASILPPSVVGRRLSFFGDYSSLGQFRKTPGRMEQMHGIRVYGGMAKMTWAFDSLGTPVAGDVALYTAGVRYLLLPINKAHEENSVVFAVEAGPTFRFLDFKGSNKDRLRALGTGGENHFVGLDFLATLQIKQLVASLYVPWFNGNGRTAGLNNAAPVIQVGIQTDVVKLVSDSGEPDEKSR